jgi:hypothetical protein
LQLNQQYKEIDETLLKLRDTYQVTTKEGLSAIRTIGGVTQGTGRGVQDITMDVMRTARAYDFEREAPGLFATMAQLGRERVPNMAAVMGQYNQFVRGRATTSAAQFRTGVAQIMEVGGLRAAPMTPEEAGMTAQRMIARGGRFEAMFPEAYAEEYARLSAPAGELGQAVRMQTLAEVAGRQQYVQFGGRWIDIRTPLGQQMALAHIPEIPEMRQGLARTAQRMGGAGMGPALYGAAANIEDPVQAYDFFQQELSGYRPRPANLVQAQQAVQDRLDTQKKDEEANKGFRLRQKDIDLEKQDEVKLIQLIERAQEGTLDVTTRLNKKWEETHDLLKVMGEAMQAITKEGWLAAAAMAAIGGMEWLSELLAEQYHPSGPSRRPTAPQQGWWPGGGAPDPWMNQQPRRRP